MNNYFYEIPIKSTIAKDLLEFALDKTTNYSQGSVAQGFLVAKVPYHIVSKDLFLCELSNATKNFNPRIFKMLPYTCYNWHVDTNRGCAINMLLTGPDSHCYFGKHQGTSLLEYQELAYSPDTYYLFNTEELHTIINGSRDRYVLSLGYVKPATFSKILQVIESLTA